MRRKIAGFKSHGINPNAKHSKSPCECIHLVRRDVYSKIMRADSQFIYRESVSSDTVRGPAHAPSKPRSNSDVYRSVSRVNTSFRPRLPLAPLSTRTYSTQLRDGIPRVPSTRKKCAYANRLLACSQVAAQVTSSLRRAREPGHPDSWTL